MLRSIEPYLQGLRARQQHFETGRRLFHRGDPVTDMHFVLAGSIHLVRYQRDGSVLILQRAGPGSILAEASLYSGTYHCDAVAFGGADTRVYAKSGLKKLLAKSPEFSSVWASRIAQELQRARLRSEIFRRKQSPRGLMPGSLGTATAFRGKANGSSSPTRSASAPKHSTGKSRSAAFHSKERPLSAPSPIVTCPRFCQFRLSGVLGLSGFNVGAAVRPWHRACRAPSCHRSSSWPRAPRPSPVGRDRSPLRRDPGGL